MCFERQFQDVLLLDHPRLRYFLVEGKVQVKTAYFPPSTVHALLCRTSEYDIQVWKSSVPSSPHGWCNWRNSTTIPHALRSFRNKYLTMDKSRKLWIRGSLTFVCITVLYLLGNIPSANLYFAWLSKSILANSTQKSHTCWMYTFTFTYPTVLDSRSFEQANFPLSFLLLHFILYQ